MKREFTIPNPTKLIEIKNARGNIGYSWNTNNMFMFYATFQCEVYSSGVHHITGSGRITNIVKNEPTDSSYGFDINGFRTLLKTPNIIPIGHGHLDFYRTAGEYDQLATYLNGFGGGFYYYETGMMLPSRFYDIDGNLGSWPISAFLLNDRINFDFYAK